MNKIILPLSYNYISAFITFACNLNCHYCINRYNGLHGYSEMKPKDWIEGLNRIQTRADLPLTITGGEPTIYKGFYELIAGIDKNIPIDLLTNGKFNIQEFMRKIPPNRLRRKAKYASIRFSFHPRYTNTLDLIHNVGQMQRRGYSVGIWAVDMGEEFVSSVKLMAETMRIDFRLKEFLDETHGNYKYPRGLDGNPKKCLCKPSELLIAPDGRLFRCHTDLYHGFNHYGHILDEKVVLPDDFAPCDNFGLCSPCDQKIKFNRFQKAGHCSVTTKEKK